MSVPRENILRRARRAVATVVWPYLPLAVGWPVLLAAGLWRRWIGAPLAGGGTCAPEPEGRAVSPFRVADPPAWIDEPELPPEAPRPDAPYVPLPGEPESVSK